MYFAGSVFAASLGLPCLESVDGFEASGAFSRHQSTVGNRPTAQPEIYVTIFLPVLNSSKEKKMSDNRLKCSNFGLFFLYIGQKFEIGRDFF